MEKIYGMCESMLLFYCKKNLYLSKTVEDIKTRIIRENKI